MEAGSSGGHCWTFHGHCRETPGLTSPGHPPDIPWPEVVKETTRSRYEGKNLPQAARMARQLLPVFPELLDEVSVTLVAAHLQPRLSSASSRSPTLPAKADRFQSATTKQAYKAAAFSVRALNFSSMLTAYQAELCEDMANKPEPAVWDEITAITDICLRVQRCAVQATGQSLYRGGASHSETSHFMLL